VGDVPDMVPFDVAASVAIEVGIDHTDYHHLLLLLRHLHPMVHTLDVDKWLDLAISVVTADPLIVGVSHKRDKYGVWGLPFADNANMSKSNWLVRDDVASGPLEGRHSDVVGTFRCYNYRAYWSPADNLDVPHWNLPFVVDIRSELRNIDRVVAFEDKD